MTLVLDTGALIALESNDRVMWARLKAALLVRSVPVSHGGVVGQAWRGAGPRQTLLAKALEGIDVRPLDDELGRAAGELLERAGSSDVIDAALAILADDGDDVVTSDVADFETLAAHLDRHVEILHV
jgi:hypothetical protein